MEITLEDKGHYLRVADISNRGIFIDEYRVPTKSRDKVLMGSKHILIEDVKKIYEVLP